MSLFINHSYQFGEFTLDTDQRILLRQGKPLTLAPKVFDTLLVLLENTGRIVEKQELMKRLWPDTFVEEANLSFNIQQLRKALGDNARQPTYIETIPRRGYRFIANVEEVLSEQSPTNDFISQRFEIFEAQPPESSNQPRSETTTPKPEADVQVATQNAAATLETNLPALPADGATTRLRHRSVALAVIVGVVVIGAGLFFWQFSKGKMRNSGENQKVVGRSSSLSSLKLEKLTQTGQTRQVAISPDGKFVAYTRIIERKQSLWLKQLATNTNVEIVLATGPNPIYGVAFANSGDSLYFVRGDPTALYRVSVVGGVPTKIVDQLEGNFAISDDDRQIAFIRKLVNQDGQISYSLVLANLDGTGERTVLKENYPNKLNVPIWSPDEQAILCSYGNSEGGGQSISIIEVNIANQVKKELPVDKFFHISKMAWLPDKSSLILVARKNLGDNNQLWQLSYPGMEIRQVTEGLSDFLDLSIAANADKIAASQVTLLSDIWVGPSTKPRNLKKISPALHDLCWTPNGQLVYSSSISGNRDLWIMRPDGSEQKQLTTNPAVEGEPAVTADNRYILFMSNRTGILQVWRMNLDGSNQMQLTSGTGKNYPAVSPDGKWVLYNSTDDWQLWKVSIDGGEPIRLTDYPASYPAVSPDGKMIACVGRNEARRRFSILVLPFEGGQPLKKIEVSDGGFAGKIRWTADSKSLIYATERNGPTFLFKQSLDDGQRETLADFEEDELFDFGYSFDGQRLAVTRGSWQHDLVLLSFNH